MKSKQSGFILIELMIVVMIIGILSSIAIPNYQHYIMRAKLAEVFQISLPIKNAIADYYAYHGIMPKDNQALFLAKPELLRGTQVTSMAVENGTIHVTVVVKQHAPIIISVRPVMLKNNIPSDYIAWLYGNCPLTNADNRQVLGINKTTLTEAQKSWLSC